VPKTVAIVDYGLGNIFSVSKACHRVGLDPLTTEDPSALLNSDAAILPGVGAFGDASARLRTRGLDTALCEFAKSGRPLLGICLGMQLLFSHSEEFGLHPGLGLLEGSVLRFPSGVKEEKVPQIQWNTLRFPQPSKLFQGLNDPVYMYFLHSYYVLPDDPRLTVATTQYAGTDYASAVELNNVMAVQFHPERSGDQGLELLKNFSRLV